MDPALLDCEGLPYPNDVKERARHILHCLKGNGIGVLCKASLFHCSDESKTTLLQLLW